MIISIDRRLLESMLAKQLGRLCPDPIVFEKAAYSLNDEGNAVGQEFLDRYQSETGRRPEYCVPVVNRDLATVFLHAFADAHPLTPRGVQQALERVKMVPAASGAPGTYLSFGKWTRRGWMGAGYLVARELDPDGVTSRLVGRFGSGSAG